MVSEAEGQGFIPLTGEIKLSMAGQKPLLAIHGRAKAIVGYPWQS